LTSSPGVWLDPAGTAARTVLAPFPALLVGTIARGGGAVLSRGR
jgi:hypothetical protein